MKYDRISIMCSHYTVILAQKVKFYSNIKTSSGKIVNAYTVKLLLVSNFSNVNKKFISRTVKIIFSLE